MLECGILDPIMKKTFWITLAGLLFTCFAPCGFCQTETDYKKIDNLWKIFIDHNRSILDFRVALSANHPDAVLLDTFETIATEYGDKCDLLTEEFFIVTLINDSATKESVQKVIARRVRYNLKSVTRCLSTFNSRLLKITKPAIAAQANKMKNDLRDFQETLEEIAKTLPKVEDAKQEQRTSASLKADK